jgi:phytol kinase
MQAGLPPGRNSLLLKVRCDMEAAFDRLVAFFADNMPSWRALALGGPSGLAWSFAALWFAGWLQRRGTKTGYTRKVFHFLIFTTVAILEWRLGTPAVCLFGAMCTLAVFFAAWKGPGSLLYEAIARPQDAPHRTYYILVPYFATLAGGLAANVAFGPAALAGYLVTGLGDAIGEPVGTMFGAHRYRVRSLSSVPATRSLEGSGAVFVMSAAAVVLAAAASPVMTPPWAAVPKAIAIAAACTVVEAVSPHGWDNLTLQIVPAALVWAWL